MFNPTKSHSSEIVPGQYKLRLGSRVPDDAANLAYSFANPLNPLECVQITDTSNLIPENTVNESMRDLLLWPDKTNLLRDASGSAEINSQTFLITDVFQDDAPLYYSHSLKFPIIDKTGPDAYGFYRGKGITIVDKGNQRPDGLYKISLIETDRDHIYQVIIYTNFQTSSSDNIKITYNGVSIETPGLITPHTGYIETLNPQPAFTSATGLEALLDEGNINAPLYLKSNSKQAGATRAYVTKHAIPDNRTPIHFKFRVSVNVISGGIDHYFSTPWFHSYVLNEDCLTSEEAEEYRNGRKILADETAAELVAPYITIIDNAAVKIYSVIGTVANSGTFELGTRPDGSGQVLAKTTADTGQLNLPSQFVVSYPDTPQDVELRVIAIHRTTSVETIVQSISTQVTVEDGLTEVITLIAAGFNYPLDSNYDIRVISMNERVDVHLVKGTDIVNSEGESQTSYDNIVLGGYHVDIKVNYTTPVFLPTYSLSLNDKRQIKILNPIENTGYESWYPRVRSGRFERMVIEDDIQVTYSYYIPEYFRQTFSETYGMPYREITGEQPVITGDRVIKVRQTPLYVLVDDNHNPVNMTVMINDAPMPISSWNISDGSIEVMASVRSSDRISVDYTYEENNYAYRGFWDEANQVFWNLDLNPGHGHSVTVYDSETSELKVVSSYTLINKIIYVYLRPAARLIKDSEGHYDIAYGSFNKSPLFHSFEPITSEANLLLLGKIHVRPNSIHDSIKLVDTRSRGGGLKEEIGDILMKKFNIEANFYWDIGYWDGSPYPENSVVIIKLPRNILHDHGGRFTKQEVETAIGKYIAYGTFFIIEYLDEPDELIGVPRKLHAYEVILDDVVDTTVPVPDFKLEIEVI